jgi:hypothetical protein
MRILELLMDDHLCESCIDTVTGLAAVDVDTALHRLTALVAIVVASEVCRRCRRLTPVFRLIHEAGPGSR